MASFHDPCGLSGGTPMTRASDQQVVTEQWYGSHSQAYFEQTVHISMDALYAPFLACIPAGGHILDAGCGSGRDAKAFLDRGYQVTAIDASAPLVELAQLYTGLPVLHLRFEDLVWESAFDGIWTCASLLHAPRARLPAIMERLIRALRVGGAWQMSFKYGMAERTQGGRPFTDFTPAMLRAALTAFKALAVLDVWQTTSAPPPGQEQAQEWTNALVRRVH
jgi:SAM-dependent methyltransferase